MLNEVRIIGRVQHPVPAKAGPINGISFSVWNGMLIRVSVPRSMERLRDVLQRRTVVYVEGELCFGGSIWARRVIVLADAKPRHIGLSIQDAPPRAETALAADFPLPDRQRGETVFQAFPEACNRVQCAVHGERCPGPPYCAGA